MYIIRTNIKKNRRAHISGLNNFRQHPISKHVYISTFKSNIQTVILFKEKTHNNLPIKKIKTNLLT